MTLPTLIAEAKALFDAEDAPGYRYRDIMLLRRLVREIEDLQAQLEATYEALQEIARGEGAYSRDPLTHAENTIDTMKALAYAALKRKAEREKA